MNTMTATIEQIEPALFEAKIVHQDDSGNHYLTPFGQEDAQKFLDKMIPKYEADGVIVVLRS